MTNTNVLDVREMAPKDRHSTIFGRLAELKAGETLTLVNDHDPVPLRYQLDAEQPDHFRWNYEESGPERWSVEITSRAHVFDARPMLAAGQEPFSEIMATAAEVGDDEILVIYAPFNPVPLVGALGEQGFSAVTDQMNDDTWRVIFLRAR